MALINCFECKKEISNQAKTCPHCGYVTSLSARKRLSSSAIPASLIGGATALVWMLALFNGSSTLFWLGLIIFFGGAFWTSAYIRRDRK